MAGHSHSANIKHRKDAVDKKRAKVFSKIARKLIVAARQGGADMTMNNGLRYAHELARAANMPKDVIQRNIDKGAGVGADGVEFFELSYEGYAPGGVAILLDILTDNRNRTAPEIKKLFERAGGNLGEPGCVGYLFETKGVFLVKAEDKSEDDIMEIAMEAEAEDMESIGENEFTVTCAPTHFESLRRALEAAGLEIEVAEIQKLPQNSIDITDKDMGARILKLIDVLDDHDDVQNVYTNHAMSDELTRELSS